VNGLDLFEALLDRGVAFVAPSILAADRFGSLGSSCLEAEVRNPSILKTERSPVISSEWTSISPRARPAQRSPAAAGSVTDPYLSVFISVRTHNFRFDQKRSSGLIPAALRIRRPSTNVARSPEHDPLIDV
jgi:hypothetical protein